ncbi:MAG: type II toxin-antitoxin system Phd/YefM family antitoxin [Cyanobacteria bacterium P01_D01_bin.1]
MVSLFTQSDDLPVSSLENLHVWKLEDAKARFSEVVRLARDNEPQRVTVRGEDAVVILSAKTFAKLLPLMTQPSIHALLSQSPLSRLDFEQSSIQSPVRDIDL